MSTLPAPDDEFPERRYAPAWIANSPGDKVAGTIVGFGTHDAGWGRYPILTLEQDNGEHIAVHAQRTVLSGELAKIKPAKGERIAVRYDGPTPKRDGKGSYHKYTVAMPDRPQEAEPDWSQWADDNEEPEPASETDGDIPF
jgi:hypothetical protein